METQRKFVFVLLSILCSLAIRAQSQLICDLGCCRASPDCVEASSIECSCQQCDIYLPKGSIPKYTKSLHISGSATVTFGSDALLHLPKLVNIIVSNVTMVTMQRQSLKLPDKARFFSLNVENAETVHIFDDAFSGNWGHSIHVNLKNIGTLNIKEKAFTYTSNSLGPSLTLENIRSLALSPGTFNAPISLLKLKKVTMTTCSTGSFGTQLHHLELHHMNITHAMPECFEGRDDSGILSVRSCHFENLYPRAISGNFYRVTVEHSNIAAIHTRGFQVNVKHFRVAKSHFGKLSTNALCIRAIDGFRLHGVGVDVLKKQALAGIGVVGSKPGSRPPATIRKLHIYDAKDGSLAFGRCLKLKLSLLRVDLPLAGICPTETWTRHLVETHPDEFKHAEYAVYHALRRRRRCPGDPWKPSPSATDGCEDDDATSCSVASASDDDEVRYPAGVQSFDAIYKNSIDSFGEQRRWCPRRVTADTAGTPIENDDPQTSSDKHEVQDHEFEGEFEDGEELEDKESGKTIGNDGTTGSPTVLIITFMIAVEAAIQ